MGIVSIGQAVPRHEDPRLLKGQGRFTGDVDLDGQAHGYVLRSPHAHARIGAIDSAAAQAAPGVLAVLTGADYVADGLGPMPVLVTPAPGFDKKALFNPPRLGLATDKVRMVGDPVIFVVAETQAQAHDAAELVEIDYQPLAAVTRTDLVADPDAPLVWDGRPDNRSFTYEAGDAAATEAAFAAADRRVKCEIVIQRLAPSTMEPRAVVAAYDAAGGNFTIHVPVQGPYAMRQVYAGRIFDLPVEDFRLITGDIGGSFGMKSFYPEMALTAWASRRLGRPVKWVNSRQDSFLGDNQGRDKISVGELALDRDGKFLGLRVSTIANLGAYISQMGTIHTTLSLSGLVGVYDIEAAHVRVDGYFSNTAPTGPYRGAGRPDAAFVIERLIDVAAAETGIDRVELRRRNLIPSAAMPYRTALGPAYDSGDFATNMDAALGAIDMAGFAARREAAAQEGKLRGLGLANNIENAGAAGFEFAEIAFAPDGSVVVSAGTTDHGQGHKTMYAQIVSDRLGVDFDRIEVREGDTANLEEGRGTGGSRVSAMGSGAILTAAGQVIERGRTIAADLLETSVADIEFADGAFAVAGTDRKVTLDEVVATAAGLTEHGTYEGKAANFPNGCHACEVEIDRATGRVALVRYVASSDLGRVINPLIVESQIAGGIAQGVGQALMEAVVYDAADGQLKSGSFQDYCMPRGADFCDIEMLDNPTPTDTNPLGAKGVGEVGTACAIPAVVNAVIDALAPFGVTHLDAPLTPEKIWRAIK